MNRKLSKCVKIKICGITNLNDALAAQALGADALGFVFYHQSPRYIKPSIAKKIISKLNKKIKKVGVFVNPRVSYVKKTAKLCRLDFLQFHGDENPEFCRQFEGKKVIKAFRVKDKDSLKYIERYKVDYFLFDAYGKSVYGGTGKNFNWGSIKKAKISRPFFLSGGLNPKNVLRAIKSLGPQWIDASSGLEASYGKKDHRLMEEFISKVKRH